jgi:hypothetical protein
MAKRPVAESRNETHSVADICVVLEVSKGYCDVPCLFGPAVMSAEVLRFTCPARSGELPRYVAKGRITDSAPEGMLARRTCRMFLDYDCAARI